MLIIENNSVYEIDEECVQKKKIPKECQIIEKLQQEKEQPKSSKNGARKLP